MQLICIFLEIKMHKAYYCNIYTTAKARHPPMPLVNVALKISGQWECYLISSTTFQSTSPLPSLSSSTARPTTFRLSALNGSV